MHARVSFELAKLLEEKGFDNESSSYYNEKGKLLFDMYFPSLQPSKPDKYFDAPTIAEAVMWLYEKYGVWVAVTQELGANITFCYQVMGEHISATYKPNFKTPTEAYEAAIEYTLNNLL